MARDGTNELLAKRRACGNMSHLAIGYYLVALGFWTRSPKAKIFSPAVRYPLSLQNLQLFYFVVGLTGCAIEPLGFTEGDCC
jgi:hypothetical protein